LQNGASFSSHDGGATYPNPDVPLEGASAPCAPAATKSSGPKTFLLGFAGALVACVLVLGIGFGTGLLSGKSVTLGSTSSATSISASSEDTTLAEQVAEKCIPSVASIAVYTNSSSSGNSIYDFFNSGNSGNSGTLTQSSLGSGVVLSSDGYICTNYHVVEGGAKFTATIDNKTYDATLVGSDSSSDIAVLKVDATDLTPIEIGDSDNISIGEWVMSIGSPFGLDQSVGTGIVSAVSRSQILSQSSSNSTTMIYPNLIQTDAAINPGNSGGALVNSKGQLIGINTLITSYSGNYSGVGFAIPSNYAINLAQQIIAGKTPTHAYLGVNLSTVTSENAQRYGLKTTSGAYVTNVVDGSPAASAGLQVGDIVTSFGGKSVTSASDLMLDVRTKNVGDKVSLTYNRDGQEKTVEVTLGSTDDVSTESSSSSNNSGDSGYNSTK
jgi:putative serine protease PepD